MPQIVNLTLSPKQASDAKFYTPLVARELRIKESDIALLRIVKRSVDARRGALKVNLSLEAYIDKEEQPKPLHFDYPSVVGKPEIIIVGAGPAGLYCALRLIELGFKPILFERGKEVVERGKDIAKIETEEGVMYFIIGPYAKKEEAEKLAEFIRAMGIGEVTCNLAGMAREHEL